MHIQRVGDQRPESPFGLVRHVGVTQPQTMFWATNNVWADTSDEAGAGIVLRRWTGTAFVPAGAAPLLLDQFSGANGTALGSGWGLGVDPASGTGGGVTHQDGFGRFTTSNLGSYSPDARVSRRLTIADRADVDDVATFKFDTTEVYPTFLDRADTAVDTTDGYAIGVQLTGGGEFWVEKAVGGSTTRLSDAENTPWRMRVGVVYALRREVTGSTPTTLKYRLWPAAEPEPAGWTWEGSDSSSPITAAGSSGVSVGTGQAASSSNFYLGEYVAY